MIRVSTIKGQAPDVAQRSLSDTLLRRRCVCHTHYRYIHRGPTARPRGGIRLSEVADIIGDMTDTSPPETNTSTPKQATLEILDFDEADARLSGALSDSFQQSCYEDVALFDGDLTIDGDFSDAMESLGAADASIIAVSGDLTVNGRIDLYGYLPGLYVSGFTRGETLECEDCEVYVSGTITYAVYFCGNEGMGFPDVDAPWVINHGRMLSCEPDEALIVDTRDSYWRGTDVRVDFDESNLAEAFVAEVVDHEEDEIRFDKFLERLRAGQPVLRDGARTLDEAMADHVAAAIASGASTLDLTDRRLKALPAGVTSMTALRTLIVDDNPIGQLPDDIGELANLEELSVRKCRLTELPESIGRLGQLRVLRVSDNVVRSGPVRLPESIGELARLEELELSGLSIEKQDELWATPFPYLRRWAASPACVDSSRTGQVSSFPRQCGDSPACVRFRFVEVPENTCLSSRTG